MLITNEPLWLYIMDYWSWKKCLRVPVLETIQLAIVFLYLIVCYRWVTARRKHYSLAKWKIDWFIAIFSIKYMQGLHALKTKWRRQRNVFERKKFSAHVFQSWLNSECCYKMFVFALHGAWKLVNTLEFLCICINMT